MGASIDDREGGDDNIDRLSGRFPSEPERDKSPDSEIDVPHDAVTGEAPPKSNSRQVINLGEDPLELSAS